VICHGGAGTVLGSLALGMPLLVVPQGADQYVISERVVRSGAGVRLLTEQVTPAAIRAAALELLQSESPYRLAARRVQAEILAMPAPEETVDCLTDVLALSAVL
jgi:UDP:flavonoid glycosyltransferase YjiC (YdhE family)